MRNSQLPFTHTDHVIAGGVAACHANHMQSIIWEEKETVTLGRVDAFSFTVLVGLCFVLDLTLVHVKCLFYCCWLITVHCNPFADWIRSKQTASSAWCMWVESHTKFPNTCVLNTPSESAATVVNRSSLLTGHLCVICPSLTWHVTCKATSEIEKQYNANTT